MAELQAGEIAISKTEYDNLLKENAKIGSLEKKIADLETETQNKSVALEEARNKAKEEKTEFKKDLKQKEDFIKSLGETLELQEDEKLEEKLEELKTGNDKYIEILEVEKKARIENIKNLEEKLGEEFLKEKEILFSDLNDEKKEILLTEFAQAKGLLDEKKDEPPKVGIHNDGKNPRNDKKTDFDKTLEAGGSVEDLISTMD